ncbi:hypothetical protein LOZ65_006902, partial [Ophidiomyces ophidiicola]
QSMGRNCLTESSNLRRLLKLLDSRIWSSRITISNLKHRLWQQQQPLNGQAKPKSIHQNHSERN